MQIDRLIQIVFLLLSRDNLTAKQLAEELGVSTRTIYRDINILSVAGIPITSQKGYGGGLSLLQGFSLDRSYFTQEEQSNMIQALQILKSSNYPDADKTLNKVAGLFSHNMQSEWLEIDFSYWGSPEKERVNITALERAIINKYVITFTYFNTELTVTAQTVEPLKLVFKSHAWYLVAWSLHKNGIRTYKMSRIRDLQLTNQLFERELPQDFSITPEYKEEYNIPVFKLHFSEKIAYKVYDEFQEKYIKKLDDGTLEVSFRYQINEWTFLYLLSFGEYVEIIEPAQAREILKGKAQKDTFYVPIMKTKIRGQMQMNKKYFGRYWRTVGIFFFWLFLVAYVFGVAKEALNSLNISICLIVLIGMEYVLGYGQDKRVIRSNQRKREIERQWRESMGETAWNEYQIKNKRIAVYRKKLIWKAVFLDLVMGAAYMVGMGLAYGKDPKWLKDAIPALLWFLIFFLVLSAWIISFPKRMREGKIFIWEVLFVAPFMVFPFFPLISDRTACGFTAFTGGTIFSVLAIGYMRQTRKKEKVCTVMTTAKVIDNRKSPVRLKRPGDFPIYAYQPVLEYYAGGEQKQVVCGDGEPSPYPLDEVYTIYYNPEKPEEFRFADHRSAAERLIGPVFLGIGIVLLTSAVGIWVMT